MIMIANMALVVCIDGRPACRGGGTCRSQLFICQPCNSAIEGDDAFWLLGYSRYKVEQAMIAITTNSWALSIKFITGAVRGLPEIKKE